MLHSLHGEGESYIHGDECCIVRGECYLMRGECCIHGDEYYITWGECCITLGGGGMIHYAESQCCIMSDDSERVLRAI